MTVNDLDQKDRSVHALWRIGVVVVAALVVTMVLSPWVYYLTRQITLFGLDEQPFRRVFDRVILVAVVVCVVLAWRWIGLTFNFKQLYRRKRAVSRYLYYDPDLCPGGSWTALRTRPVVLLHAQ